MKSGIKNNKANRILKMKKSAIVNRLMCFIVVMSMILTGCTNIVAGDTKPQPVDYTRMNEESGLSKMGMDDSKDMKVKINYSEGSDLGANKFSATYVDAFYVAPDLSNKLEDVSYFNLLDTYEATNNGTTFVYAYRTKKYQNNLLRDNKASYKHVEIDEGFVMFPDIESEADIPVSDESYLVLATYSFARGKSSYHELARIKSDENNICQSKVTYHTNDSLNDAIAAQYTADYYSVLDKTDMYIFDAKNVKAFSDNRQAYILDCVNSTAVATELSDGNVRAEGNGDKIYQVTSSSGTSSLEKITKAGFFKYVDMEEEIQSVVNNGLDQIFKGGWDIDIYDYSIYVNNRTVNIYFEMLLAGSEANLNVGEEDDDTDYNDETEGGKSYEYVGNITISDIDSVEYTVEYYNASKEVGRIGGYYNYIVWPTDTARYVRARYNDGDNPIAIFSPYFGNRTILIGEDGSRPLDLIYNGFSTGLLLYQDEDGHSTYFKVDDNVQRIWEFKNASSLINNINETVTLNNYNKRCISSPEYAYGGKKYQLVSSDYLDKPNTYFDMKDDVMVSTYVIGNLGIKSSFDYIKNNVATLNRRVAGDRFNLLLYEAESPTYRRMIGDGEFVYYNIIPNLKLIMEDTTYHSIVLKKQKNKLSAQFLFDDVVMLYDSDGTAFFDAFPLGNISTTDAFTTDKTSLAEILTCNTYSDKSIAGEFKDVQGTVYENSLYMTYVFDNQLIMSGTKLSIPNDNAFQGGGFSKSVSSPDVLTIDLENLLIKDKNSVLDRKTKNVSLGSSYKADYASFFSGMLTRKGEIDDYIMSTSPTYGIGLYDLNTNEYFIPTFQRHKISNIITTVEEREDGSVVNKYDMTKTKDEIVSLRSVSCFGVYKNTFTKDKEDYPYLFMGFDRDGFTYTDVEMLRAKMIPFGIAYNNGGNYYRDFKPLDGEDCVYYLRDSYYSQYGTSIVDKEQFNGDVPADEEDPYNPKGDIPDGDKTPSDSTIYDDDTDDPDKKDDDGKKGSDDGKKGSDDGKKGGDDSKGSGNKDGDGKGGNKGDGDNGIDVAKNDSSDNPKPNRRYGYEGYDKAKKSGFDGVVDDGTPKDGENSIFADSESDNSAPDESISDNSVIDQKDKMGSEASKYKSSSKSIWIMIIIVIVLSIATIIIYRYKRRNND